MVYLLQLISLGCALGQLKFTLQRPSRLIRRSGNGRIAFRDVWIRLPIYSCAGEFSALHDAVSTDVERSLRHREL